MFQVGQNTSTGCTSIQIVRDTELEGDQLFTVSITSAGTEPYVRIRSPSVATVIIEDFSTPSQPPGSDDESGVLSLQLAIAIPALCSVVVGVASCLLATLLYRCLAKQLCCPARPIGEDPVYADIVVNNHRPILLSETDTLQTPTDHELGYEFPLEIAPNEAYAQATDSLRSHPETSNSLTIMTSHNESYAVSTDGRVESGTCNREMGRGVITTSFNEAYSGLQTRPATLGRNALTDQTTENGGYLQVIP